MSPPSQPTNPALAAAAVASAAAGNSKAKKKLSLRKKRKRDNKKTSSSSSGTTNNASKKKRDRKKAISDVFASRRARGDCSDDVSFRFGDNNEEGNDDGDGCSSPGESTVDDSQESTASSFSVDNTHRAAASASARPSSSSGTTNTDKENRGNDQTAVVAAAAKRSSPSAAADLGPAAARKGAARPSSASSASSSSSKRRKRNKGGIPIPSFSPVEELPPLPPRKKERPKSAINDNCKNDGNKVSMGGAAAADGEDGRSRKEKAAVTKSKKRIGSATPDSADKHKEKEGTVANDALALVEAALAASAVKSEAAAATAPAAPAAPAADPMDSDDDSLPSPAFKPNKKDASGDGADAKDSTGIGDGASAATEGKAAPAESGAKHSASTGPIVLDNIGATKENPLVIDVADSDDEEEVDEQQHASTQWQQNHQKQGGGKAAPTNTTKKSTSGKEKALSESGRAAAESKTGKQVVKKSTKASTGKKDKSAAAKQKAQKTSAKPKAQTKRKRQPKQETINTSPVEDDTFEVPRSKRLADQEKTLDRNHSDLLRQLAKKPSPGKESEAEEDGKTKKRPAKRSACALCSTCSCSRGSVLKGLEEGAKAEARNPLSGLARSDAEIERALLGQLSRLEKNAALFDTRCYEVGRDLKKHRTKIMKKRASFGTADTKADKQRFLADAEVDYEQPNSIFYPRAKKRRVARAHQGLFGTEPSVKETQPTLTQMMRGETGGDASDDNDANVARGDADDVIDLQHEGIVEGSELERIAEEEEDEAGLGDNEACERVGEAADTNDSVVYKESEGGSPLENRSPLADLHDASRRGVERASESSQIRMWDAATTCAGEKEMGGADNKEEKDAASDDFNQKVNDAVENVEENGISDLLELFQEEPSDDEASKKKSNPPSPEQQLQSQLTQRGQGAVEDLQGLIMADTTKLKAIEAACPNWQDSIRFPFLHTNPDSVKSALANVRDSRRQLSDSRERILTALAQRDEVLALFESSLEHSLNRFAGSEQSSEEEKKAEMDTPNSKA